MNRVRSILPLLTLLGLAACQQTPLPDPIACSGTGSDSQGSSSGLVSLIDPRTASPIYHTLTSPRLSQGGSLVTLDYMVHEPTTLPARALLVLIPGGDFDANLTGTDGGSVDTYGSNFLVRSSYMFAERGYRVITMDRPSDYLEYMGSGTNAYLMDAYRTSVAHGVDLATIVDSVNASDNLPVILLGTSRGAISAVAQAAMFSAIAISSPLTGGSYGDPVSHADAAKVTVPAHVLWHADDACSVTVPVNAYTLSGAFPNGDGVGVSGGFSPSGNDPCGALSYHGFLGIESCAVSTTTTWLDALALPATRPDAASITDAATVSTAKDIDLSSAVTAAMGGELSYSLPFTTTTKGGSLSISDETVTYTPAASGTDTFVYVVKENGGGTAFNTVTVNVSP